MSWNDERIELLKKLWIEGLSMSHIAAELGGVTRNAVVGKLHRLGINRDFPRHPSPSTARTAPRRRAPARAQAARIVARAARPLPPEPKPVVDLGIAATMILGPGRTLMELTEETCRYPVGNPSDPNFLFCGALSQVGSSYCQVHFRVCNYIPTRR